MQYETDMERKDSQIQIQIHIASLTFNLNSLIIMHIGYVLKSVELCHTSQLPTYP